MAKGRNYLKEDSGWALEDETFTEKQVLYGDGNPSVMGALTGILTEARNFAEQHRLGGAVTLEDGTIYVNGLEDVKNACMTADNRGEAMQAYRDLETRLIGTISEQPNSPMCDCTKRARMEDKKYEKLRANIYFDCADKHKSDGLTLCGPCKASYSPGLAAMSGVGSYIRGECALAGHEKGFWNRYTILDTGFGSRYKPKYIMWVLANVMGAKRWANQHGSGYKNKDGIAVPSLSEIEKLLDVDEPNYRPKESWDSKKHWQANQAYNRTENEPGLDQQQADKSWRHHDHYERGTPTDASGKVLVDPYPDTKQTIKALWIPPKEYQRWEKSRFSQWFDSTWETSSGTKVKNTRLEKEHIKPSYRQMWVSRASNVVMRDKKYVHISSGVELVKWYEIVQNQPMVGAREDADYKFVSKPLIDINGISNNYGEFTLEKGDSGYFWRSGNYELPAGRLSWLRSSARDEIFNLFSFGYPKWPGNQVGLDLDGQVVRKPETKTSGAWIKDLGLDKEGNPNCPIQVQQRWCYNCRHKTFHMRDIIPRVDPHMTYCCPKHEGMVMQRKFWGNQEHLKCMCCGMIAKTVIVPLIVKVGFWTLKVGVYGRFAEEMLALMEAKHTIELNDDYHVSTWIDKDGHKDVVVAREAMRRDNQGNAIPVRSAWWYINNVMTPQAKESVPSHREAV